MFCTKPIDIFLPAHAVKRSQQPMAEALKQILSPAFCRRVAFASCVARFERSPVARFHRGRAKAGPEPGKCAPGKNSHH